MGYTCPVCGYPELTTDPYYIASFEICPSCRFQFCVSDRDRGFTYEQWRQQWINGGMVWDKRQSKPPADWNPRRQLQNIGVEVTAGPLMNTPPPSVTVQVKMKDGRLEHPIQAVDMGHGIFRLLGIPDYQKAQQDKWEFLPGSLVRCETKQFHGRDYLLAVAKAD